MPKFSKRFIFISLSLFTAVALIRNQSAIIRAMDSMYLLPRPEKFTELYFENHTQLPKLVSSYSTYQFTFTIHNLEYGHMDYPYEVYIQRGDEKTLLATGSASLDHDQYVSLPQDHGPFKNLRTQVVVELLSNHQKIHFWMEPSI